MRAFTAPNNDGFLVTTKVVYEGDNVTVAMDDEDTSTAMLFMDGMATLTAAECRQLAAALLDTADRLD